MKPGDRVGRYVVDHVIDTNVYCARHDGWTVALKVFPAVDEALFAREAAIATAVVHPALLRVIDAGTHRGRGWLALEHVPGLEVQDGLERFGAIGVRRTIHLATQLFAALNALHCAGIVHGDVKPANLLVDESRLRLVDYGLGRFASAVRPEPSPTAQDQPFPGTMEYMHPDLYAGGAPTPATDVFAAWITTYELLVRARPYTVGQLARGALPRPPSVQDDALDALLAEGLAGALDARASRAALDDFLVDVTSPRS